MSVKYIPVQWNNNKYLYDLVMLAGVALFLYVFLYSAPGILSHERPINAQVHNARAFGACAFVMLTVILCIGPLARLDTRFLPLLYNRRHFGVMTVFVALTHAFYVINWYFAFSMSDKYEALLFANTAYGQLRGFPFETFGIFALIVLIILAATSHDFWMKFLTPPVWKRIHYLIYPAYLSVVAHVSFGILQDQQNHVFTAIFLAGATAVGGLHLMAALTELQRGRAASADRAQWIDICDLSDMREGFAKIRLLPEGDRVAVFLHEGKLSAISNACAHQNGPLGEGRIIDCLVTCPWHGFQYDVRTGRSPAPFTEKVPTYTLRLSGSTVQVDPRANPPGTPVEPVPVPGAGMKHGGAGSMNDPDKPFFVGYLPAPRALRAFLLTICVIFVSGLAGLGLALGVAQDDPGEGAFRFDYGRQTVTGVVELTPYPLLRVTQGSEHVAVGRTLMLAGQGKTGVDARAAPLEGQLATASGVILNRGDLEMMQLRGGQNGLAAAEGTVPQMLTEPLGRWRLAGEICDGKCLAGAMRPGRGIAHKACANLCLLGDIPPVFVTTQPVQGHRFLLITFPGGTKLPAEAYHRVAQFVTVEGDVERRGDLLVLAIDPATLERAD